MTMAHTCGYDCNQACGYDYDRAIRERDAARAEAERLREALREIADFRQPGSFRFAHDEFKKIARAALAGAAPE